MIRTLYTLILALASPFLLYGLYKKKPGKPSVGQRWVEHFGFSPTSSQSKPLWIHAVSVGEVIAAKPIIKALREQYPSVPLLITTTTSTGAEQAMQLGEGVEHRYMPIDFSWTVRGFLKRIQPRALLIMETELWPNTLATVKQAGLPITVLNARLSERSKQRYQQFQTVFDLLSNNLDQVICQYKEDADRFMALGIEQNKVSIAGSVKFDITVNAAITTQPVNSKLALTNVLFGLLPALTVAKMKLFSGLTNKCLPKSLMHYSCSYRATLSASIAWPI